jgi:hypothetical protein
MNARYENIKKVRDFCIQKRTAIEIAQYLGCKQSYVAVLTQDLRGLGMMRMITEGEKIKYGWRAHFLTTSLADIDEDEYMAMTSVADKRPKDKPISGARVFRMEYFDRIPGYFKSELRAVEHRGIPSVMGRMD